MNHGPSSWATRILGFALTILVACAALKEATNLLLSALPVLVPALIVGLAGYVGWQYYRRSDRW